MKTLIVLSDTHGNAADVTALYDLFAEADYVVHLGDGAGDIAEAKRKFGNKVISVSGNCDFFRGETERVFDVEGVRFFACHGHTCGVKSGLDRLFCRAAEAGAAVALYGHTHEARIERIGGVLTVNPGTLKRLAPMRSFAYIAVHGDKVTATINDKRFAPKF